jgi:hypothetical protein
MRPRERAPVPLRAPTPTSWQPDRNRFGWSRLRLRGVVALSTSGFLKSLLIGGVAPVTDSATLAGGRRLGLPASLPPIVMRRRGKESSHSTSRSSCICSSPGWVNPSTYNQSGALVSSPRRGMSPARSSWVPSTDAVAMCREEWVAGIWRGRRIDSTDEAASPLRTARGRRQGSSRGACRRPCP